MAYKNFVIQIETRLDLLDLINLLSKIEKDKQIKVKTVLEN